MGSSLALRHPYKVRHEGPGAELHLKLNNQLCVVNVRTRVDKSSAEDYFYRFSTSLSPNGAPPKARNFRISAAPCLIAARSSTPGKWLSLEDQIASGVSFSLVCF